VQVIELCQPLANVTDVCFSVVHKGKTNVAALQVDYDVLKLRQCHRGDVWQ
jgi:hypothetical protein